MNHWNLCLWVFFARESAVRGWPGRYRPQQLRASRKDKYEPTGSEKLWAGGLVLRPAVLASQSRWVGLGGAYSHSAPTDHRSQKGSTALWGNLRREFPSLQSATRFGSALLDTSGARRCLPRQTVCQPVCTRRAPPLPPPPAPVRQCLASPRQWMSASGRQPWLLVCSHSYWHQTDAKQQRSWISLKFSVQRLLLILCSDENWHQFSTTVVALVY